MTNQGEGQAIDQSHRDDERLGPLADALAAASLFLARRFAAGATMWCWAPRWPAHADHIAVEFVHPVIVGARALPAVAVDQADPVMSLRTGTTGGDILVVVGTADEPAVTGLMRRAEAWGLGTVWIGCGGRPPPGAADHLLWVDDDDGSAAHMGELVRLYHLLWELTHVCFDHPGLLDPAPEPMAEDAADDRIEMGTCITCADEGRLGEVLVAGRDGLAQVRTATGAEPVDITLVEPVQVGDLVLIHAGSAISLVEAAQR